MCTNRGNSKKKLFLYNIFQRRGNKGVFFIPPWQKCPSPGIFYFQFGQFYVKIMSSWGVEGGKGVQDLDFHKITIYLLLARITRNLLFRVIPRDFFDKNPITSFLVLWQISLKNQLMICLICKGIIRIQCFQT